MSQNEKYLMYAGIAVGVYFVFFANKQAAPAPAPTAASLLTSVQNTVAPQLTSAVNQAASSLTSTLSSPTLVSSIF